MTMLSRTTLENIESLADTIIENFTSPELISGCIISDVLELNLFGTGDGWVIALCGKHNNQRVRVLGGIALGVGDVIGVVHYPSTDIFIASFSGSQQPFEAGKSGIYTGGVISAAIAPNVDISAGTGQIVDSTTNLEIPAINKITWSAFLNEAPLNILTTDQTLLFIDSGGLLVKQNSTTETDFRDKIFLGALVHVPPSAIIICDLPTVANNVGNYLVDLMTVLRIRIVSGGIVTPNSSLTMQITSTEFFGRSINFRVSQTEPNILTSSAENPMIFAFSVIDGLSSTGNTILDVANYNPTGSTISPIGGGANSGGLWRVYKLVNGADVILYPQFFYSNLSNILDNEDLDDINTVVPQFLLDFGILICKIATQKNVTDLSLTSTTRFIYPSSVSIGEGGSSTWLDLSDTDSSFAGKALRIPRVNVAETALEIVPIEQLVIENASGVTTIIGDLGAIDENGKYIELTTANQNVTWCVVLVGGVNGAKITVARTGRVTVVLNANCSIGDFLVTSTTAGQAGVSTIMRSEIFARALTANSGGAGGTCEAILLTGTRELVISSAITFFETALASTSAFTGTINGAPTATSFVYAISTGQEDVLKPSTAGQLGKMLIHNTTRGTFRLIDSTDLTTNTVTTVSSTDSWADLDVITISSQTVTFVSDAVDIDLSQQSVIPLLTRSLGLGPQIRDSGTGTAVIVLHPFISPGSGFRQTGITFSQVANISNNSLGSVLLIDQKFSLRRVATGVGTATSTLFLDTVRIAQP